MRLAHANAARRLPRGSTRPHCARLCGVRLGLDQPICMRVAYPRRGGRNGHQPAGGQQRRDQLQAAECDALAGHRRMDDLVVLVEAQHGAGFGVAPAGGGQPVGPLEPGAAQVAVVEVEQGLAGQRIGGIQRAQSQRRMRDRRHGLPKQPDCTGRRIARWAIPDGKFNAFVLQVDEAVVGGHAHVDVGVLLLEASEARQQPQAGDADAGGDRDRPPFGRHANGADGVLQLLHGAVGAAEQAFALGRERNRAVPAYQQLHTQRLFQCRHLPAHRRLRQAQIIGRERDAHAPAYRHEAAQQVQGGQSNQGSRHALSSCKAFSKIN